VIPNINGGWLSKGELVYIITQIQDKFVWRTVHRNGVTETGIGCFSKCENDKLNTDVEAQWNFHGGDLKAKVHNCKGTVIINGGKATEICWKDKDDFRCLP
jgi:hypothetical protein